MMKYFIVSEDELKEIIDYYAIKYTLHPAENYYKLEEIKDTKQPVEMVAEGEVFASGEIYESYLDVGDFNVCELLEKYNNKSIKIFIQEQEVK